jgi:chromosome partitioning protein
LLRSLSKIQDRLNRNLKVAGILPTMFDGRTIHANEVLTELQTNFPGQVFDILIKDSVRVKESPATGLSILDYDQNHDVARAYMKLAMEVDHG